MPPFSGRIIIVFGICCQARFRIGGWLSGVTMTQVKTEIDSIRVAAGCPDELTLILRKTDGDSYVPLFISQHQGEILANELHERPDGKNELDPFLASNNATDSDIGCATIYLEDTTFFAKVLFS